MRITIVGPVYPYRGGIAHYTTTLSQKLSAAGHAVQTISFKRQYPAWLYPGQSDKDPSAQHDQVPALYTLDPIYFWTWGRAAQQIQSFQPDIVIFQWWTTFWAPAFAVLARWLRARGLYVAFLIHNVMPHEARLWDNWLCRLALSSANQFIVQTENEANRLRTLIPRATIVITPHPIYNMFADKLLSRSDARHNLSLPEGAPIILFFGIVRPYKGLRYLLQAFQYLLRKRPNARLIIAGEFWEPLTEYESFMRELGIRESVSVYNQYIQNEDIPTYFSAADVFAAPYVDGTQSGAVKMALGFGLPIVITNCILDDMLKKQEDVWLAKERDAESLANAITAALEQSQGNRLAGTPLDDWYKLVQVIEGLSEGTFHSG